ncbi:MAG: AbrB/MazE/SpoVT family DNA-binding domain-containing protein [Gammaproteobacteria bacterium]|nr:AbrB/MazE/SpoVT family DNA-binding domain-containing protein [Gammaproteobacteria bacterium]
MELASVTSKGQVTIPKQVRQHLGIHKGTKIEFIIMGEHVELCVRSTPVTTPPTGFGMLKSRRPAIPADFDPAELLRR